MVRKLTACLLAAGGLVLGSCAKSSTSGDSSASPSESAITAASPTASSSGDTPSPGKSAAPMRAPQTFKLDSKDKGKNLTLVKGDKVVLTLETNDSTGYAWVYDKKPDPGVLEQVSDTETTPTPRPPGGAPMVGAPQKRTWTFITKGGGSTSVKLRYQPPGDSGGDRFTFSVSVT